MGHQCPRRTWSSFRSRLFSHFLGLVGIVHAGLAQLLDFKARESLLAKTETRRLRAAWISASYDVGGYTSEKRIPIMAGLTVIRDRTTVDHAGDTVQTHVQRVTTPHFVITYSPRLGPDGPALAEQIASRCEQDYAALQQYFGGITPAGVPFQIRLRGGGGRGVSVATGQIRWPPIRETRAV
jgi:hypothetical protein